jgi:hypothetical protein
MFKKKLSLIFDNTPIPNPNNKGKRFICGWKLYKKQLISNIISSLTCKKRN